MTAPRRPSWLGRWALLLGIAVLAGALALAVVSASGPRLPEIAPYPNYAAIAPSRVTTVDPDEILAAGGQPLALHVVGRTAPAPNAPYGFRHQWPGIYAEARFEAPSIVAAFDDDAHRYRIVLDGAEAHVVDRPGRQGVLIDGLGPGPHEIRLEKLNESFSETGTVRGIFLPEGTPLDPPPDRPLQFEFIGDSDSAGFGVTSETRDCTGEEVRARTDTHQTYGALVARHFDADYQINAQSGIGVVRNYEGADPDGVMTRRYPNALIGEPAPWEDPSWIPDLIVVALGSNDFGSAFGTGERWSGERELRPDFEAEYLRFLLSLREMHPQAHLLLVVMEGYGRRYEAAHEAVAAAFRAESDARIEVLQFPGLARTACNWHPSRADHLDMAEALVEALDAQIGL